MIYGIFLKVFCSNKKYYAINRLIWLQWCFISFSLAASLIWKVFFLLFSTKLSDWGKFISSFGENRGVHFFGSKSSEWVMKLTSLHSESTTMKTKCRTKWTLNVSTENIEVCHFCYNRMSYKVNSYVIFERPTAYTKLCEIISRTYVSNSKQL